MFANHLMLNPVKTETLLFRSPRTGLPATDMMINVGNHRAAVRTSGFIRLLGVELDPHLSFTDFTLNKIRSCYAQIRMLSVSRPRLSTDQTKLLANALILSRIDYCCVLLSNCPKQMLHKLHGVIVHTARIILKKSRREHVTPMLNELGWLDINNRILYRQAFLLRAILHGGAPIYLSKDVTVHVPNRNLRSGDKMLLTVHHARLSVGNLALKVWSSAVWNSLPSVVRDAKSLTEFCSNLQDFLASK
jgi:hypothetical protein